MLQRTKGRILLGLLVITGMAGTLKNNTLTLPERKVCVSSLKETRNELLQSVMGLTARQLQFRPTGGKWTIGECIEHIALAEKNLEDRLSEAMKQPADLPSAGTFRLSDEAIIRLAYERSCILAVPEPDQADWQTASEAINRFRDIRSAQIKYMRNTTEDLRNHSIEINGTSMDCYQWMLYLAGYTHRHLAQIREILADPDFPQS